MKPKSRKSRSMASAVEMILLLVAPSATARAKPWTRSAIGVMVASLLVACTPTSTPTLPTAANTGHPSNVAESPAPVPKVNVPVETPREVDVTSDARITSCEPREVVFGYKTTIGATVHNKSSKVLTYSVTAGVIDDGGNLLDQEDETFWLVEAGASRTNRWTIRTAESPTGCVIVSATAS